MSTNVLDMTSIRIGRGLPVAETPPPMEPDFHRPTLEEPHPKDPPFPGLWRMKGRAVSWRVGGRMKTADLEPMVAVLVDAVVDLVARLERVEVALGMGNQAGDEVPS